MFMDDHRKIATIMVSKRNKQGEQTMAPTPMKAESVKSEEGEVDPKHIAAQDVMAAFHSKSAQKLSEAMSNFLEIHHSSQSESNSSEE